MGHRHGHHRRWRGRILLTALAVGGALALTLLWRGRREHSQDQVIRAAAQRYGVDPALVKAVVWRESWFDPRAVGRAGEIGLMQVTEPAAREWAAAERNAGFVHTRLFDPAQNTLCGTWYLRKLLRRYPTTDNPLPYALADYNAGRSHVLKWARGAAATNSAAFIAQIGFPMTRDYVRAVMGRRERYRVEFPALRAPSQPGPPGGPTATGAALAPNSVTEPGGTSKRLVRQIAGAGVSLRRPWKDPCARIGSFGWRLSRSPVPSYIHVTE